MIAVALRMVAQPAKREELRRCVHELLLDATRAEDGCLAYRLYEDTEQPEAFSFVEEWRDWDALNAHFRSEHVGRFLGLLDDLLAEPPEARFMEVKESRGLEAVAAARGG